MLGGRNSTFRLLLERMHDPDIITKLQPVDDPIRIAAFFQDQFPDTGPEALQGLGDIRRESIGNLRQGTGWPKWIANSEMANLHCYCCF